VLELIVERNARVLAEYRGDVVIELCVLMRLSSSLQQSAFAMHRNACSEQCSLLDTSRLIRTNALVDYSLRQADTSRGRAHHIS
jgi:hypothetical protein